MILIMKANLLISSLGIVVMAASVTWAQPSTLQDVARDLASPRLPKITIYVAKEIITLDPSMPQTEAVAVVGDRILATGTLETLKAAAGDQEFEIDETFVEKVIVPGFIAQHDHRVLTALTMAAEVLAIEELDLADEDHTGRQG